MCLSGATKMEDIVGLRKKLSNEISNHLNMQIKQKIFCLIYIYIYVRYLFVIYLLFIFHKYLVLNLTVKKEKDAVGLESHKSFASLSACKLRDKRLR